MPKKYSEFLIPVSLQRNVVEFKKIEFCLIKVYQRFTSSGYKDIGTRIFSLIKVYQRFTSSCYKDIETRIFRLIKVNQRFTSSGYKDIGTRIFSFKKFMAKHNYFMPSHTKVSIISSKIIFFIKKRKFTFFEYRRNLNS